MRRSDCTDTMAGAAALARPDAGHLPGLSYRPALRSLLDQVVLWHERSRQRRHLAGLSDHMLRDIGLSRADVWQECEKPFWRP